MILKKLRFLLGRFSGSGVIREYYSHSDFWNFGYWFEDTRSQEEACENLMEKLLAFIPEKKGTILDVACGKGATTRYLLRYYQPSEVTGIDIWQSRLETAKLNAPGCALLQMDAAKLGFGNSVFDNIICVEAAFAFDTREDFLRQAHRVLKPSGHLVLADALSPSRWIGRAKNYVRGLREYRDSYLRAGFQEVEVIDVTNECWTRFYKYFWRWGREKFLAKEIGMFTYTGMILGILSGRVALKHYLLVLAQKA
jgi:ubiquinone/menaquinone biosynthesis C-methylase UbiE